MSDRLKSTNNVANEQIIDDLTNNLEYSLNTDETQFDLKPSSSTEDATETEGQGKSDPLIPDDAYEKAVDENAHDSDADSFDEELKDAELELTEDQKAERQILAEEFRNKGNEAYRVGDYEQSLEKYTEGLRICPLQCKQLRAVLYCNRGASRMKLQRYKAAAADCGKAVELDGTYLKAYFRRAQSYEAIEQYDESLADFKRILELDPEHREARAALHRLPPLIEARNERLKTEMMGKLKDLGNMLLRPFGLSTENFKLEQDPDSQGYKINFKQ